MCDGLRSCRPKEEGERGRREIEGEERRDRRKWISWKSTVCWGECICVGVGVGGVGCGCGCEMECACIGQEWEGKGGREWERGVGRRAHKCIYKSLAA